MPSATFEVFFDLFPPRAGQIKISGDPLAFAIGDFEIAIGHGEIYSLSLKKQVITLMAHADQKHT
jgi:hypothetical protein